MNNETLTVPETVHALNPVLSQVRCSLRHSQETPFFQGVLTVAGQRYEMSNDGRGGCIHFFPCVSSSLMSALDKLVGANLPPITDCGGCQIDPPMAETFETWAFGIAYASAEQRMSKATVFPLIPAPVAPALEMVAAPSPGDRNRQWWPDLYLKKGRTLQQVTPAQCYPLRMAYNNGRGASEIKKDMALFDVQGEKIGHVSFNGRVWLHDVEGNVEIPS